MSILSEQELNYFINECEQYVHTLKLPKKQKRREQLRLKLEKIKRAAEVEQATNQIQKWIDLNEGIVNKDILKNQWKKVTANSAKKFVLCVINSLAINDAIIKSQNIFKYTLGMDQINIDLQTVERLSDKVFSINVLKHILDFTNLDKEFSSDILHRFISSQFPYKDYTHKEKQQSNNLSALVGEQFENVMRQAILEKEKDKK